MFEPIREHLEGPAVWKGEELFTRPDWRCELSEADIAELSSALNQVETLETADITPETFPLPTLGPRLKAIQDSLEHGCGATMIRGFPADRFSIAESERIFWGMAQHLGTPISQTAAGERIFHVRDEGFGADDPRTRGPNTRKKLSFHTDRCDVIAFMCLRRAKSGGENFVVSSPAVYNEMQSRRPDLAAELMKPFYYKRHNVDLGNENPYCRQPIFSFCGGHFAASYLRVLIDRAYASPDTPEMTETQREALDYLEELAEDPSLHVRFHQEPGDILLLNNWVTLHRRSEFEDHAEPEQKRHLLRIWLSVPNSRPIDPLFEANFGATAAGTIRGGMRARA